jgi:Uma2 family endonuclease
VTNFSRTALQLPIDPPFLILKPGVSEEEFFQLANEDISCELIGGTLMIHSPASREHESIFRFLLRLLADYLAQKEGGEVLGSRFVMRLGPQMIPEPDLLVILPASVDRLRDTHLEGPADIVFEILSPSTRKHDLEQKLPLYLDKGVREVWIIDPEDHSLSIHSQNKPVEKAEGEMLIKSRILSAFGLSPEWLWGADPPSPSECLLQLLKDFH